MAITKARLGEKGWRESKKRERERERKKKEKKMSQEFHLPTGEIDALAFVIKASPLLS